MRRSLGPSTFVYRYPDGAAPPPHQVDFPKRFVARFSVLKPACPQGQNGTTFERIPAQREMSAHGEKQ
jgi:hypothetical protein